MNKGNLIEEIAKRTNMTKADSERALNATLSAITKAVKKESVQIVGFGTFRMVKTKARVGVNPQDPSKKIKIPSKNVMKFKASKKLKY